MPRVSVIIPAHEAHITLPRCLACLGSQSFMDFETIVVDSGPRPSLEDSGATALRLRVLRSRETLLAHTASNRAAAVADGELLAFLDADAYASPGWLAGLVEAWKREGGVVMGGVACYGSRWIDRGAHFAKFDKWLPGLAPRRLTDAATVNLLMARSQFEDVGPFLEGSMHADTDLSWRLRGAGVPLSLVPNAVVEHHHRHSLASLWGERRRRGRSFSDLWMHWNRPSRIRLAARGVISALPLRLVSQTVRVSRNAMEAGELPALIVTLPVVIGGLYAWLLGESAGYLRGALRSR
ncbi:MAG TPA: glycosyltransferase [Anaerolineales bacterium]|nr:glycosyltransferase [Anaerolineales bacterium]